LGFKRLGIKYRKNPKYEVNWETGSKIGQIFTIFDRGNEVEKQSWKDVSKLGKFSSHKYW